MTGTIAVALGVAMLVMVGGVWGQAIPDEYVVQFTEEAGDAAIEVHMASVRASGATVLHEYNFSTFRGYSMRTPHGSLLSAPAFAFLNGPEVFVYEANQVMKASAPVGWGGNHTTRTFAAECNLQEQATWGLVRTAESSLYIDGLYPWSGNFSGAGVFVYVVDTGIYLEHADFERRAIWGFDAVDDPSPETDLNGHGTHCAGTVMSKTYGIAKHAAAVAVRVLNAEGSGTTAGVISGVQFVSRDAAGKRAVASMSLGGDKATTLNNAVKAAVAKGVPFIVAAGNDAKDACGVSPASEPTAITVMCSDSEDVFCYFSNYGTCTDIIAPGMGITSTWINGPYSDNTISGTSMSTPHVAGVAARILSGDHSIKTAEQVRAALAKYAGTDYIRKIPTQAATVNSLLHFPCA